MVSHKAVNDHDHTKDIPKPLEMKLPCEYQESSLLDHQDGWCIANKQRRTTLCHAARRQRQLRRSLSLHPQWTLTRRPRINENQERLTEEEHAVIRISIGW
jgi:hypothetical protein